MPPAHGVRVRLADAGRAVTMQDIADRCAVSLITVSRALRHDSRVKADTARRILDTAEELGYDPSIHHAARRLALRRHGLDVLNHVIALFLSGDSLQANYFNHLFRGILSASSAQGYALLTADLYSDSRPPAPLPLFTRGEVDGFIILGWTYMSLEPFFAQLARAAHGRRFPIVSLLDLVPGCAAVLSDDRAGACAATAHLLELGHRRILHFWNVPDAQSTFQMRERAQGCRQAYLDRGLDPDRYLVPRATSGQIPLASRLAYPLHEALQQHPDISAVLLPNDSFALQARDIIQQHGLRIPEDVSMIGFDDAEVLPDERGQNMLTSVAVPLEAIGRAAATLLIDCLTSRAPADARVILPTTLQVRQTTAPCRHECI